MKFFQKYHLVWIVILLMINYTESAPDDDEPEDEEDDLTRTFRLDRPQNEQACRYRRREGICKRRSECRRPTRHTCRYGANPIICCLDRDEVTTTTTRSPPRTTRRTPDKVANEEKIDLTFPNCGLRSPKVSEDNRRDEASSASSRSGRLLSRRLGKRDVVSDLRHKRVKRWGPLIKPVIVGGTTARSNSWPWMTAIFKTAIPSNSKTRRFLCGASLISRHYVLTAAHCFDAEKGVIDASKFSIVVGSHTTKDGTEYSVQNVLIHSGYQKRQYYNDLCLLKLVEPVKLTQKVYPVCLPSDGLRNKIITGANNVTVTGWGDTTFGGVSSQVLQEVSIPIVPLKECNASYTKVARSNFPRGITNLFICAGEKEGGKDACQGDSGGPLVTKLKDGAWVQLGVVSFGFGCAQPGFPGVYTRLSQYTKWLYENTDLG